ncbi:MAG: ABC transporter ATP-binding protein [Lachnospiraceae bacterium]|nr:ABC transporter ATP-binding protein [Lachnospiraceae bacterium]
MKEDFLKVRRLWREINYILSRKQKVKCLGILIMILIGAALETLSISVLLPLVSALISPNALMGIADEGFFSSLLTIRSESDAVFSVGIITVALFAFKDFYLMFLSYKQVQLRWKMQCDLSERMLKAYIERPYTYFLDTNSSIILRGVTDDVNSVYTVIEYSFQAIAYIATILLILGFLFITDFYLALIICLFGGAAFGGVLLAFRHILKGVGTRQRTANAEQRKYAYQTVNGIKEIDVMNRKSFFVKSFKDANDRSRVTNTLFFSLNAYPPRIIELICVSVVIVVVCLLYGNEGVNVDFVANMAVFAAAIFKIVPMLGGLVGIANSFVYYWGGIDATYENIVSAEEYVREKEIYAEKSLRNKNETSSVWANELRVTNISWQYPRSNKRVLDGLSLVIKKNEAVGIIGSSGAGKTTLSDIIMGLYKPQYGTVEIDGIDIFAIPKVWCKTVGYVPQKVFLTDDTIRANVTFGLFEDEIDDKKVWEAIEMAQLKTFVESLPDGIYTKVGERGVRLSGGQCQRIAIARALYYNPSILVLDEATSALDNETEKAVMEAIDSLLGKKTLIIIAHRLSTIKNCDSVYEIVDGKARKRDINYT